MNNNSVFFKLLNAQQEAMMTCVSISKMLKDNLAANEKDPVILPVYSATGRWVNQYWLSGNKVGRHGFKGAYEQLKSLAKYTGPIDALKYVAERDKGDSKYEFFNCILLFLYTDFVDIAASLCKDVELASSIMTIAKRLKFEHETLGMLISQTIDVMRGKDEKLKEIKPKQKNVVVKEQQMQVEEIVNMQLDTLRRIMHKDVVARIRTVVMRSDNKLKALKEELDKIELPF